VTTIVVPTTRRLQIGKVNRVHDALGRFAGKGGMSGGGVSEARTPQGHTYLATSRSSPSKTYDPMRPSGEQRTTAQNEAVSRLVQHSPWSSKPAHEAVAHPARDMSWPEGRQSAAQFKGMLAQHADAIVGKVTPRQDVRAMLEKPLQRAHAHLDLAATWGAGPRELADIKNRHEEFMTVVGYRKKFGGAKGGG
jgi:hypothetical protein